MLSNLQRVTAAAVASVALCSFAAAQSARSGGGASAALMQQVQQLGSERTQLQGENARLKQENEALKKQVDGARKEAAAAKAGLANNQAAVGAARAANESTVKQLEDSKAKMQELIARFKDTLASMRQVESDRTQLQQQVAQKSVAFDKCAENNFSLYQITGEVLDRYEHQGAFSYMARSEPFTRISRTRIENLVDEYRQRAQELKVIKGQEATPPNQSGAGTPAPIAKQAEAPDAAAPR
jgi:chromosome segregation ATPase